MRIPFAVGRLKGDFSRVVVVGEDWGPEDVPFFRGARVTRSPARFRPHSGRNPTRPV